MQGGPLIRGLYMQFTTAMKGENWRDGKNSSQCNDQFSTIILTFFIGSHIFCKGNLLDHFLNHITGVIMSKLDCNGKDDLEF